MTGFYSKINVQRVLQNRRGNNNSFVEIPCTGYVQPMELGSAGVSLGLLDIFLRVRFVHLSHISSPTPWLSALN